VGTMFQQLKIWHLKAWTKKKKKNLNQPWNINLKHGTSKVPCFICLGATWLYYQMSPLLCMNL
jgi:hypothetical protein